MGAATYFCKKRGTYYVFVCEQDGQDDLFDMFEFSKPSKNYKRYQNVCSFTQVILVILLANNNIVIATFFAKVRGNSYLWEGVQTCLMRAARANSRRNLSISVTLITIVIQFDNTNIV